jgi:NAD(P)-dependent dehydrogenase (short-subunit alcohol dehydrogenase family)
VRKVSIVTGAAGGIGRAIALQLAKDGCDVVLADMNLRGAKAVAKEIESLNRRALPMKANVAKSKEVNGMVSTALKTFGRIDILVNNAGGSAREKQSFFHQSREEIWDYVIGINLKGVLNCCRAVINQMMRQKSGKIVNIASYAGICGVAGVADYSAAKAGIIGFTRALAKEIASYGIHINCVSPGPIETPGFLKGFPAEALERMKKSSGFDRFGKPEEIADMVAFLASEKASFISGQNFPVCGIRNLGS